MKLTLGVTRIGTPFWRLAATLVLSLGPIACGRPDDPAYDRGSTVVMAVSDVREVLPDAGPDLDFLFFLRLATWDERGELQGRLARSWEHSADHKEYTFHLRTDVRWQDGVPTTAHDVKFTLDLLGHPDVAEYPGIKATVVDDSTVTIRASSLYYLGDIVYYPKHLLEGLDPKRFWEWEFWRQPVGNGPYRFVRYMPPTLMEFAANPDYYRGKPRIERVILKFVGEAGLTELLTGQVDMAQVEPSQTPRIANDSRFRIYRRGLGHHASAIYWKANHPLFQDPRVRRALTHALDRREMLGVMNLPADLPITDAVLTSRQFRRREWSEPLPYDTAFARTLLAAAGWVDRNGDGILDKDGRPFRFTASVGTVLGREKLAVHVQAQLRRVGVQMDIQMFDNPVMWDKLRGGDFVAWMHSHSPQSLDTDFGRGNPLGYANVEAFKLLEGLERTADPDEEDRIYRKVSEIFRADPPMVRLIPVSIAWFVHRRIRGLSASHHYYPAAYMEDLWIEK
ncbi:MAG TPA: ABC transporter substrate-binding protein [Gemmatimonadaceae bacterium]|nr:ABC transporter substrate-binding protein [Gemmatimonadaceae bacterium]